MNVYKFEEVLRYKFEWVIDAELVVLSLVDFLHISRHGETEINDDIRRNGKDFLGQGNGCVDSLLGQSN
jgi:hypothetical protein